MSDFRLTRGKDSRDERMDQRALPTRAYLLYIFSFAILSGSSLGVAKAWSNPSQTAPNGEPGPIVITLGGTQSSNTAQDRSDLGVAASGANTDITSLSPSGNLIISPTGGVGIGTTSLGTGALVTVNGNLVSNGELQSTLQTGDGQIRMIAGNYGAMWRNDGTNTWFLLTASGNQYGGWNTLRPMQINDSSGEVYMANGLDVTSGGITFPDGTVQTTAATNPATGTATFATPGTYTWTVPSGVTRIFVEEWGAGGGGIAGSNEEIGGSAGAFTVSFLNVSQGSSVTITVGSGGLYGSSPTNGSASSITVGSYNISAAGGVSGTVNNSQGQTPSPPTTLSNGVVFSIGGLGGGLINSGVPAFPLTSSNVQQIVVSGIDAGRPAMTGLPATSDNGSNPGSGGGWVNGGNGEVVIQW